MSRRRLPLLALVLALALVPVAQAGGGLTDAQAVAFLRTGKGLPGVNRNGAALTAAQQAYALRTYRAGPYRVVTLNLFYAVAATGTHSLSKPQRQAFVASVAVIGRQKLIEQTAAGIKPPGTVTRYGVTVRQVAEAMVRGMLAGAA